MVIAFRIRTTRLNRDSFDQAGNISIVCQLVGHKRTRVSFVAEELSVRSSLSMSASMEMVFDAAASAAVASSVASAKAFLAARTSAAASLKCRLRRHLAGVLTLPSTLSIEFFKEFGAAMQICALLCERAKSTRQLCRRSVSTFSDGLSWDTWERFLGRFGMRGKSMPP